ncbi:MULTISPECIES: EAL domain-containing protein [Methylomonas]|uniref:PAS domain S-box protein n=2 Tax=Methylomonas TaxID=416 RepID=A0A140E610_9GAMM|nr:MULTISPECIES: EAL domain-containing protein [Methylomonas]AMK78834.1 PAS domain S-box protein [Methylomonas denitrificans]OAH97019.1 PAS domain S-box protein [Methylomonas methanica]TCV75185.1 diguanylate cyclase/phosphodiesterase with PAS/PAC sensor(s) [Methylomonas methanica]
MTAKPRILVVDDDPMIRLLVKQVLHADGYELIETDNGRAGLEQFIAARPDLVLLDVMMPEMDGFSCLEGMRAASDKSVPIVMMTAIEDAQAVEDAFRLGATDFIGKPIQWPLLPHRISYVLRSHRTTQTLIEQQSLLKQSEQRFRDLVESIGSEYFLYSHDTDCTFTYLGPSVEHILGYTPEELRRDCFDITTDNPINRIARMYTELCLTGTKPPNYEVEVRCKDGSLRLLSLNESPMFDAQQRVVAVNGLAHDITEMRGTQQALADSEERLRLSMQAAKQGFYDLNPQTGTMIINAEYAGMLGYDPACFDASIGSWTNRLHPDDRQRVIDTYQRYIAGELAEYRLEYRQRCADDSWKWVLSIGSIVERDAQNQPVRMLGTHTDITDSKMAAERLNLLAKVFENSGEAIFLCDPDTRIVSSNQAYTNITGYRAEEVLQRTPSILDARHLELSHYQRIWQALRENGYWQGEIWDTRKNGESYPAWLGISAMYNTHGVISHYIGIFSDITERKAAEAQIEYLARHDPLTNLPNRTLLRDRFDQAMAHAVRNATLVGLLFLDLDHFKNINDTMGHDVGDRLLQGIAERLVQCVREVDTVCRQGGDEFIIILTDIPDIEAITQIVLKILDQLTQPFSIEGVTVCTSFSIGVSLYPNDGLTFHSLLNKADTAMYSAKNEGRNTFRFFSNDMNLASIERMNIENGLRLALKRNEFRLHYQPQYSIHNNTVIGAEALLRWQPENSPMIPPAKFIPIAEDNGLIVSIGDWVLREACRQNKVWHDAGLKLLVTVNISALQFKRGNLLESVQAALNDSGLEPRYLELELTESVLMFDTNAVINTIAQLRALGVSFAIDDFGTGYSSLSYLKRFAVNKLKIDQSFIRDLTSGKAEDTAIVKAILQLGDTLGLLTLAEGVETKEQAEQLSLLGCRKAQGFYWNQPLPADEFARLFTPDSPKPVV